MVVAVNMPWLLSAMELMAWTTSRSGTPMDHTGASMGTFASRRATPTKEVQHAYSNTRPRTHASVPGHRLRPRHHRRLRAVTIRQIGGVLRVTHAVSTSPTTIAHQMVPKALDGSIPNGVQSR